MLENTGQASTKVPNSLALVAAEAVVEQAKKFQEQIRRVAERQRALEHARAQEHLNASREEAVNVSVGKLSEAPKSSNANANASAQPQDLSRGATVDFNA